MESADDEAASAGSAVHHIMAVGIPTGDWLAPAEAAALFGADADEVGRLSYWARQAWEQMKQHFPRPQTEVPLHLVSGLGIELDGHVDVLSFADDEVRVLDFKSGRVDRSADDQLRGYAYLGLLSHPEATRAYSALIRVRDQTSDGHYYERAELEAWWTRTAGRLLERETYRPGRHCIGCQRRLACPATAALIERSMHILTTDRLDVNCTPTVVGRVYDAAKVLEQATELALDAVRLQVKAAGGTLVINDGRQLEIRSTNVAKIDARLGLPVLEDLLPKEQLAGCVTIGKGKVEKAVSANAPKGQKGKAIERALEMFAEAGALHYEPQERLEVRRSIES